jgi:hypothetical protein
MLYIKVFSQFIFYLAGTFLHEIAHYIVAKLTFSTTPNEAFIEEEDRSGNKITKKVSGFTIVPRITKNQVIYGHVLAVPKFKIFYLPIAIAPLVWIVTLYYLLAYFGYLNIDITNGGIYIDFAYGSFFTFDNWILVYISLQLLWAGTPSSQDIKMAFSGLFSISSLAVTCVLYACYITIFDNADIQQLINLIINKGVI